MTVSTEPTLFYDGSKIGTSLCRIRGCDELVAGKGEWQFCPDHSEPAHRDGWVSENKTQAKARMKKPGRPRRTDPRFTDSAGYVHIRVGDRYYTEHHLVMVALLGRALHKGESVHHRNGQRNDNRPENLELWVTPIRKGARAADLRCPHCGEIWAAQPEPLPSAPGTTLKFVEAAALAIASDEWEGLAEFSKPFRKLTEGGDADGSAGNGSGPEKAKFGVGR